MRRCTTKSLQDLAFDSPHANFPIIVFKIVDKLERIICDVCI